MYNDATLKQLQQNEQKKARRIEDLWDYITISFACFPRTKTGNAKYRYFENTRTSRCSLGRSSVRQTGRDRTGKTICCWTLNYERIGASMRERAKYPLPRNESILCPRRSNIVQLSKALAKRTTPDCGSPFASFSDSRPLTSRGNNSDVAARDIIGQTRA